MQRLLSEATEKRGLLTSAAGMVGQNKRYIFWFWLLNVLLSFFGTVAFFSQAGTILDHSLLANRLVHGFDLTVLIEMLARPEFGPTSAPWWAGMCFAVIFFLATALFLPGVLQGYASTYRLPREDFFRACGRNLWRFIRLMIVAGIVMGIATGVLFGLQGALVKVAGQSTYELLPFVAQMICLAVIFLVMTTLRIWFDLAEADVVLSDQRAVRKSIGAGFRHTWRHLGRLLMSYVVIAIIAAIILVGGLWAWMKYVPPDNVLRAFLIGQLTLLLLLIPRFWQRGVAVSYYRQYMVEPVGVETFTPAPVVEPEPAPVGPGTPPEPQAS